MEDSAPVEEEHSAGEEYQYPLVPDPNPSSAPTPWTSKCSQKPSCWAHGIEYDERSAGEEEMVLLASKVLADAQDPTMIAEVNR